MALSASNPAGLAAASADMSMLETWYNTYGEAVHRRCQCILNEDAAAWDATQEVFVRAHRGMRSFRAECSVLTWLFAIANRYCFGMLRQQRRRAVLLDLEVKARPLAAPAELEQFIEGHRLVGWLGAKFGEDVQQIVALRFFEELEQEEIAARLGISRKTVQRKLSQFFARARQMLCAVPETGMEGTQP